MTKEELKQEAEGYTNKLLEDWELYDPEALQEAYIAGAEPREKRNAELEKENKVLAQNLEDTEILNKTYEKRFDDLKKENAELKCECRRCVYTDSPCILSDYGKDRNGICDHFKDVFDENAELKEKKIKGCYFGKDELGNDFFAKCDCVDCQKRVIALLDLRKEYLNKINKESYLNDQLTKAKEILKSLYFIIESRIDYKNNIEIADEMWRAEQFLSEVDK